jgi:hypothetical protein
MKIKEAAKAIFLTPGFLAPIPIIILALLYHWAWTREAFWRPFGDRGKAYDVQETSGLALKIRAAAYYETGIFLPGAYKVFESSPVGLDNWREIYAFRIDDPLPLGRYEVRFIGNQICYVFMSGVYLITTNGGQNWFSWKPLVTCIDGRLVFQSIKEVTVWPDGTGTMALDEYDYREIKKPICLHTKNYGRNWL